MKKQITFVTGKFETGVSKQAESGDRLLGKDLALWLISECENDEFTFSPPAEDAVGWYCMADAEGESFRLGCEILHADVGANHAEWRVTVDRRSSWNIFKRKESPVRGRLCDLIHNVLREEGEMREVQWGR